MAKTDFSNGTIVQPDFLDSIFLTNGGHVHDGNVVDADGHCSKVNLSSGAHVTGALPWANVVSPEQSGYFTMVISSSVFQEAATGTAAWVRWGNMVSLRIPQLLGVLKEGVSDLYVQPATGQWPAQILPAVTLYLPVIVTNGASQYGERLFPGLIKISAWPAIDVQWDFYSLPQDHVATSSHNIQSTWNPSYLVGINNQALSYPVI